MKKITEILTVCPLFAGIEKKEMSKLLHCLDGRQVSYKKNAYIIHEGQEIHFMGIILSGSVKIVREDFNGNVMIMAKHGPVDFFAEVLVCAGIHRSPVSVQATEDCEIYRISAKKILTLCSARCFFHTQLIQNLLSITAAKALELSNKIGIISKRSTREKILLFLNTEQTRFQSKIFQIPFNRQSLADYLCVNRSALSRELTNLQKDGFIRFNKNRFEIIG